MLGDRVRASAGAGSWRGGETKGRAMIDDYWVPCLMCGYGCSGNCGPGRAWRSLGSRLDRLEARSREQDRIIAHLMMSNVSPYHRRVVTNTEYKGQLDALELAARDEPVERRRIECGELIRPMFEDETP